MARELREHELVTLKTIAETLNGSNEFDSILQEVLEKLLELTGLTTGWIFLAGRKPSYTCKADVNLPEGLSWGGKTPMKQGGCWCFDRFWDGRLKRAVNILNCKRLEDAADYAWGDTAGLTHHATIPLRAGDRLIGILNVAAPGKAKFSEEELALLQSVAYQIGSAIERIQLFQAQSKRADRFAKLGSASKRLGSVLEAPKLPIASLEAVKELMDVTCAALYLQEGGKLTVHSRLTGGVPELVCDKRAAKAASAACQAIRGKRIVVWNADDPSGSGRLPAGFDACVNAVAVPLLLRDQPLGALVVGSAKQELDETDAEALQTLADHISIAYETARLYEERQELARWEERNRLARDLHDSVNQMLFSLSLTAGGMEAMLGETPEPVKHALNDMKQLSRDAQREMRSLILQLRPPGLEEGLAEGLRRYGQSLGLEVSARVEGVLELPRRVEETLLRIGQEALNNARKHSGSMQVSVIIRLSEKEAVLRVTDHGNGFSASGGESSTGLGLGTMRERAEAIGGTVRIRSKAAKGTTVEAHIPIQ